MLPAAHRLRQHRQFQETVRRGARAGGPLLVVHLDRPRTPAAGLARAGLVVPRAVGSAVARNRVKRRLRHLLADRLPQLPSGASLVVRALPPAVSAGSASLAAALDAALESARQSARWSAREGGGRR